MDGIAVATVLVHVFEKLDPKCNSFGLVIEKSFQLLTVL